MIKITKYLLKENILTLFTSPSCTLCEPVKFICEKVVKDFNKKNRSENNKIKFEQINIFEVEKWKQEYEYRIPVVHINNKEIWSASFNENKLEEVKLKAIIESLES
tara:strand:- start:637 stop:954 length:318 start_codon:yes stop_codon:yes gene_type:complete